MTFGYTKYIIYVEEFEILSLAKRKEEKSVTKNRQANKRPQKQSI